jgi:hypothetical protein
MALMARLDLTGARAKIERAKKHICDLDGERSTFLNLNPYRATPEYYPEYNATAYYLDNFAPVPEAIPLIAGDAAHNLRSALDHLACALIKRVGNEPTAHTYFPVCESSQKYKSESARKVEGISLADKEAIDLIKPYGGGNDSLWGLHRLDIIDKHKLLITPVVCVNQIGYGISQMEVERMFGGILKLPPGAILPQTFWFPLPPKGVDAFALKKGDMVLKVEGDHETNQNVELTFDIAFGEPEVFKGRPLVPTLQN